MSKWVWAVFKEDPVEGTRKILEGLLNKGELRHSMYQAAEQVKLMSFEVEPEIAAVLGTVLLSLTVLLRHSHSGSRSMSH